MLKKLISAAAIGVLGLAAATFGSAQAAVTNLGTGALALPADPLVIQTQAKGGKTARRSAAPRRASPRRQAAPRRASTTRKAVPRRAAPHRSARAYRWSRDRRYRFYGPFFAVPLGFSLYATHPCYDWGFGPSGWGYYWNEARCPL